MDTFLDAIADLVILASESWLGIAALTSPIWLLAALGIRRSLSRRRSFREFATARGLEFAGTIPSDTRAPYTRIRRVASAVLLFNVIEGQWDGLTIRVFDMSWRRNTSHATTVLVVVEDTLLRGPEAERVIAGCPTVVIDMELDTLIITPGRLLQASELGEWLTFGTTLAKAMERDFQETIIAADGVIRTS